MPFRIILDRLKEIIRHADRVVGILTRDAGISLAVPICVIGRKFNRRVTLTRIIQDALDIGFGDRHLFCRADCILQRAVFRRVGRIREIPVPCLDRRKEAVEHFLMHLRASNKRSNLLFFDHLPIDESFDIRVVCIHDHHLCRAACGAARLDGARRTVTDFQKAHQTAGFAAARQFFTFAPQHRKVRACARAIFEQARFAHPEIHDPALIHQIVRNGLDETSMRLGMLIGRG